ncbi:hypothetical protein PAPYR_12031 [Paratrimastix pyriformis]|uniref:Uncharacterized protein n=1 Tax=Paratrimastix pyriformis TaxID=342808 RepID=A0ABQ8U9K3_9EUKA|nr:hypothetical protein PAPYR_12031 [Paratrimastix pyriformis]
MRIEPQAKVPFKGNWVIPNRKSLRRMAAQIGPSNELSQFKVARGRSRKRNKNYLSLLFPSAIVTPQTRKEDQILRFQVILLQSFKSTQLDETNASAVLLAVQVFSFLVWVCWGYPRLSSFSELVKEIDDSRGASSAFASQPPWPHRAAQAPAGRWRWGRGRGLRLPGLLNLAATGAFLPSSGPRDPSWA